MSTPADYARMIPDEVVEASYAEYIRQLQIAPNLVTAWRAALAAGLAAWQTPKHQPMIGTAVDDLNCSYPALILPLENTNDNG